MNILFCSAGRRGELIKNFKESMGDNGKVVATDISVYAPALYLADVHYIVPRISEEEYIPTILSICKREKINAITTLIDPEIVILAKNRQKFLDIGVEVLAPYEETAKYCYDKYDMYKYLSESNIPLIPTYDGLVEFNQALNSGKIEFPVFVKPRTGSGSVGARKIDNIEQLELSIKENKSLIIQKLMAGVDVDCDVYVDTISHKPVSIFSKRKIESRIGGASKTISFIDYDLYKLIETIIDKFDFNGPIDMDFFHIDGKYYLSEINPRFGGAYLHAFGSGVDFFKMILNNINGVTNVSSIGYYEDGIVMMMYDSVVIKKKSEIINIS